MKQFFFIGYGIDGKSKNFAYSLIPQILSEVFFQSFIVLHFAFKVMILLG